MQLPLIDLTFNMSTYYVSYFCFFKSSIRYSSCYHWSYLQYSSWYMLLPLIDLTLNISTIVETLIFRSAWVSLIMPYDQFFPPLSLLSNDIFKDWKYQGKEREMLKFSVQFIMMITKERQWGKCGLGTWFPWTIRSPMVEMLRDKTPLITLCHMVWTLEILWW